ncbi:MAG TPA: TolC family protein [Tepidisphaeraceae bacterium]|nr:TolC family protein [Tepidisphaeraceae bacterium]
MSSVWRRMGRWWCALPLFTVALVAIVGCAVNQAKEVATYRKVIGADREIAPFIAGEPLTLERALELSNQYNERLGLQGEQYLQSLINRDRAAAAFMPTVNLVPTATIGGGSASTLTGSVPVNGSMNVFNGFQDLNNFRSAKLTIEQQRALLLNAQAGLLLDVAGIYYQILRSEASVEVLRNTLTLQEERVRDMQTRLKVGWAKLLDVAQSEAQASDTRVLLLDAKRDVINGRSTLAFLVAAPVQDSTLSDAMRIPQQVASLEQLQNIAVNNRQDLAAAAVAVGAARYAVSAAVGQYYPSLSVDVNAILARRNLVSDSDWNAIFVANLPIFSAGLIEADVRQAWSVYRQAKLAESQTRRQVVEDVEIAYHNLQISYERLKELEVEFAAAEAALRLAEEQFTAGLATNLERLRAQDQRLAARLRLVSEQFDQKVFYLNLLRAVGRLSLRLPGESATMPATLPVERPMTIPTTLPATMPTTVPGIQ